MPSNLNAPAAADAKEEETEPCPSPVEKILLLCEVQPTVPAHLYSSAPTMSKAHWSSAGAWIKARERLADDVRGDQWFTLRLDGSNFGRFIQACRDCRLLGPGYSSDFASLMVECAETVMRRVHGVFAYTQSDEMTIVVAPQRPLADGSVPPHVYRGRVAKLGTLAAALATHAMARGMARLAREKGVDEEGEEFGELCGLFDCRVGAFDGHDEVMRLVLWRAFDCGINGVSDKCHQLRLRGIPGAKEVVRMHTGFKLKFLEENGMLPLPDHQAYGTVIRKSQHILQGFHAESGRTLTTLRRFYERTSVNLLNSYVAHREVKAQYHDFLTPQYL